MTPLKKRVLIIYIVVALATAAMIACCNKAHAQGIMPPTNLPLRVIVHPPPTNQIWASFGWVNSLPGAAGWTNERKTSVWSYVPQVIGSRTNGLWLSNNVPVSTNSGTNFFWFSGGEISFTNVQNNYHWTTNFLDLLAASNDMRTGLVTLTNLHFTNGVIRTNLPFALSNRVTLRMATNEFFRAFSGPRSK